MFGSQVVCAETVACRSVFIGVLYPFCCSAFVPFAVPLGCFASLDILISLLYSLMLLDREVCIVFFHSSSPSSSSSFLLGFFYP